jgi:ribosomal protein S18 acetylase RimI-like enzyme
LALRDAPIEEYFARAASYYTFDQLAALYNQARIDYIVPMPMNAKRMAEYVHHYDIDLGASQVALDGDQLEAGLIMIGLRDWRSWATRLGVIPERRGHKIGQYLMELLIEASRARGVRRMQLEVIKGNEPAYRLFRKLGFEAVRELLVIRRPPGAVPAKLAPVGAFVTPVHPDEIPFLLHHRDPNVAWTEETPSLIHANSLNGLYITLPSGETGWVVFQRLPFQLTHFVITPGASDEMAQALLYSVHRRHALQDTIVENLPRHHSTWQAFQKLGYIEVFSRIEMILTLRQ